MNSTTFSHAAKVQQLTLSMAAIELSEIAIMEPAPRTPTHVRRTQPKTPMAPTRVFRPTQRVAVPLSWE